MAQVCRSTWGETVLAASDGQLWAAALACLATSHWTASALRGRPPEVGKSGSVAAPARSVIQLRSTATVWVVNGVARSLRPLPHYAEQPIMPTDDAKTSCSAGTREQIYSA